jgi:hypothetical protein
MGIWAILPVGTHANGEIASLAGRRSFSGSWAFRAAAAGSIVALCATLAGCDRIDTVRGAFAHSEAVSRDLEKSLGLKPMVGFNWNNGSMTSVNVTFPGIPAGASLSEIIDSSRQAVRDEFKETPKRIIVGFNVPP